MNKYFLISGILCFIVGLLHSSLGEYLIYKDKRNPGSIIPTKVYTELKERHLRIIWATWHVSSFFGWCIGALLVKIALDPTLVESEFINFIINCIIYAMFVSSLIVLIGTKGRHPGWIAFLLIVILLIIGK